MVIELKAENQFRLTRDELEAAITPKTKILVLPFPNNPTGAVMERSDLEELVDVIVANDLYVIKMCIRDRICISWFVREPGS